jgi:type IV secretion system protein VirB3
METLKAPVYQSVIRPILFLGGDRELTMIAGLLCAAAIFSVQTWVSVAVGILVWLIGLYFLQKMAKADPLLSRVYLRHIAYKAFYPARSSPWRTNTKSWQIGRKGFGQGWHV